MRGVRKRRSSGSQGSARALFKRRAAAVRALMKQGVGRKEAWRRVV